MTAADTIFVLFSVELDAVMSPCVTGLLDGRLSTSVFMIKSGSTLSTSVFMIKSSMLSTSVFRIKSGSTLSTSVLMIKSGSIPTIEDPYSSAEVSMFTA